MSTTNWLLQAETLANFAQAITLNKRSSRSPGRKINAMNETSVLAVDVTCSYCKKKGHTTDEQTRFLNKKEKQHEAESAI
jgi:hypothetical protein